MIRDPRCYKLGKMESDDFEPEMFADHMETSKLGRYPPEDLEPDLFPDGVHFTLRGTQVQDVPWWNSGWLLLSDRLKGLIEKEECTGARFFPVTVHSQLAIPVPRYWYAHLTRLAGAIDFEASIYRKLHIPQLNTERLMMVRFAFKHEAIAGWDLFSCKETSPEKFCSPRFRELFLRNRCTGMGFYPIRVS